MWRQPKTVWAVAFAWVIAFMGIGLVDPILKPIADELGAGPAQVSLLFTSYMAVMGVAMLVTGWVSSRLGAKRTLLSGLAIIIVGGAVAAGAFVGINNTLITETVMKVTPVERGVASAAYSFVRFSGGAVAPWLAGKLGEQSVHLPFWVGAVAVMAAVGVFLTDRDIVRTAVDAKPGHGAEPIGSEVEAEAVTVGDA